MKRLMTAVLMGATLVSCAPTVATTNPAAPYAAGEEPVPTGETRTISGAAVTRSNTSALEPRLTYPGNAYSVTGNTVLDDAMSKAFKADSKYRCAAPEHHMWFRADGARLELDTTARLKALGYVTKDTDRDAQGVTIVASNGTTGLLMNWTLSESVTAVSACRVDTK
ncbi:hypothetical protein [Deinococcus soli (ex Cha et al. 2016)]|uniref:Uncharacterized protein n=2 Tax=Deinococcus soli (ex Cha et al. 2016) TaxID=1309411 RepID=A0ACC6KHC7_9DEIO|nr:hypothetical protein [Deinococcus soli (ex Cha et al. 2016)]MDR6218805.1 hypothetical protein [Deinococcus soli (ex Cha et al. 2016)]MDR6328602.1 hypothetical protein [Deinococcus soli (ex Cha et al. 2016)]MDR6751911.1 hypothetical protein [Deinococcus soli (ex Cha et al. 2016)]